MKNTLMRLMTMVILVLLSPRLSAQTQAGPPVLGGYTNNNQSVELSEAFAQMSPQLLYPALQPVHYSAVTALPQGLFLNLNTGKISRVGTPLLAPWTLTVRASNILGSSQITVAGQFRHDRVDFGMNVNFLKYYSRAHFFPNLMTQSNSWKVGAGTSPLTADVPLLTSGQAAGYPNFALITTTPKKAYCAIAIDQIDTDGNCALPLGTYRLQWDGSVNAGGSVALLITEKPGTPAATVTPTPNTPRSLDYTAFIPKSMWVVITSGSTLDPVRNVRVWMPNTEIGSSPYATPYDSSAPLLRLPLVNLFKDVTHVNDLAKGPIRFMDWCRVNECGVTHNWSVGSTFDGSRLMPNSQRQSSTYLTPGPNNNGLPLKEPPVAYEYMIETCNQVGADLWINLPHQEEDDPDMDYGAFCTGLADLILYGRLADGVLPLHSSLNVYVEWSNEVWNGGFRCKNWISEESGNGNITSAAFQDFQVAKMLEMYSYMKSRFLAAGQESRFRFVVMGWITDHTYLDGLLMRLGAGPDVPPPLGGTFNISTDLYGAGCSFYFRKPTNGNTWPGGTEPAQMVNAIMTYVQGTFTTALEDHRLAVKSVPGLKFILYEGGVSVPGTLPLAWRDNWYRANKNSTVLYQPPVYQDYGMYNLYRTVFNILRAKEVDVAVHYGFLYQLDDDAGVWQLKENEAHVPSSPYNSGFVPKLDAWIEGPPPGL